MPCPALRAGAGWQPCCLLAVLLHIQDFLFSVIAAAPTEQSAHCFQQCPVSTEFSPLLFQFSLCDEATAFLPNHAEVPRLIWHHALTS